MCGSYGYAAPEIMSNKQRYDYSVDLYSLGVMMYMLLSGGDQATNNPKQRLPPMQHPKLKRKLRDAAKRPSGDWAADGVGALKLLETLTSDDPKVRKTAREMKKDSFFVKHLNHTVDYLLEHADHSYLDPPRTGSL
jgi:serine/threonine protein kinase